ncbi:hypothetical protein LNO89_04570 [Klebsiella pneumoniae subsp. pneumoniae]|nr:hypothetical protein [Klebsiella pneumoniae subsp. pneumoniae]
MPSEACEPYRDEEGRLLHRPLAEHVVKRIEGQPAIVTGYNDKRDSEPAPLPFSLSALQIEGGQTFRLQRAERAGYLPEAGQKPTNSSPIRVRTAAICRKSTSLAAMRC